MINYKKFKFNDVLLVTWQDIEENAEWLSNTEAQIRDSDCEAQTVGFFTRFNGKYLYLSSTKSLKERSRTTIPIGVIESVQKLK